MALYPRIIGTEQPKIPVHQLFAALEEYRAGSITVGQVRTAFSLTAAEAADLGALRDRVVGGFLTVSEIERVCYLAEGGLFYSTEAALRSRLGV